MKKELFLLFKFKKYLISLYHFNWNVASGGNASPYKAAIPKE